MIRKATKQNVVMEHTNLYDHFFVPANECKAKVSAARLPYFDSDYWPGEAEMLLQKGDESVSRKKRTSAATKRVLRAFRRDSPIGNPKDILLMHQVDFFPLIFEFLFVITSICRFVSSMLF